MTHWPDLDNHQRQIRFSFIQRNRVLAYAAFETAHCCCFSVFQSTWKEEGTRSCRRKQKRERGRKGRRGTEKGGKGLRLDYCRMAENVKRRTEKRLDVRRKWSLCRRPKLVLERNCVVHMWTIYAVAGVRGSLDKTSRAVCCAGSRIGFNAKNSSVLGLGERGIWGWVEDLPPEKAWMRHCKWPYCFRGLGFNKWTHVQLSISLSEYAHYAFAVCIWRQR